MTDFWPIFIDPPVSGDDAPRALRSGQSVDGLSPVILGTAKDRYVIRESTDSSLRSE